MKLKFSDLHRWMLFATGLLVLALSFSTIYVSSVMRHITISTERFEGIPCYAIAIMEFLCGILLSIMIRPIFRENFLIIKLAIGSLAITISFATVAVAVTSFLVDRQSHFYSCTFHEDLRVCSCYMGNDTSSGEEWHLFRNIDACERLDFLFRCMLATIALHSMGVVFCFSAIVCLCFVWRRLRSLTAQRHARISANAVRRRELQMFGPHAFSDWDSWLFRSPFFRRLLTEWQLRSPPTYEATQRQRSASLADDASYHHRDQVNRLQNLVAAGTIVSSMANLDVPPPDYSRIDEIAASSVQVKCNNHLEDHAASEVDSESSVKDLKF